MTEFYIDDRNILFVMPVSHWAYGLYGQTRTVSATVSTVAWPYDIFAQEQKTRTVNTVSPVTLPLSLRSIRSPDRRNRTGSVIQALVTLHLLSGCHCHMTVSCLIIGKRNVTNEKVVWVVYIVFIRCIIIRPHECFYPHLRRMYSLHCRYCD